jgi:hypothetical protein
MNTGRLFFITQYSLIRTTHGATTATFWHCFWSSA